jgi:hypothetical protein
MIAYYTIILILLIKLLLDPNVNPMIPIIDPELKISILALLATTSMYE